MKEYKKDDLVQVTCKVTDFPDPGNVYNDYYCLAPIGDLDSDFELTPEELENSLLTASELREKRKKEIIKEIDNLNKEFDSLVNYP